MALVRVMESSVVLVERVGRVLLTQAVVVAQVMVLAKLRVFVVALVVKVEPSPLLGVVSVQTVVMVVVQGVAKAVALGLVMVEVLVVALGLVAVVMVEDTEKEMAEGRADDADA